MDVTVFCLFCLNRKLQIAISVFFALNLTHSLSSGFGMTLNFDPADCSAAVFHGVVYDNAVFAEFFLRYCGVQNPPRIQVSTQKQILPFTVVLFPLRMLMSSCS